MLAVERRHLLAGLAFVTAATLATLAKSEIRGTMTPAMIVADAPPTTFALFFADLKGGLLKFGGAYTAFRSCATIPPNAVE